MTRGKNLFTLKTVKEFCHQARGVTQTSDVDLQIPSYPATFPNSPGVREQDQDLYLKAVKAKLHTSDHRPPWENIEVKHT